MAMSIVFAAGGIGGLVLAPVIMVIIERLGWRSAYFFLFVVVLVFMAIVPGIVIRNKPEDLGQVPDGMVLLEPAKAESSGSNRKVYTTPVDFTLSEAIRTRALWLLIFVSVVVVFTLNMFATHQIAFLQTLGIAGMMAAAVVGISSGMQVVGAMVPRCFRAQVQPVAPDHPLHCSHHNRCGSAPCIQGPIYGSSI